MEMLREECDKKGRNVRNKELLLGKDAEEGKVALSFYFFLNTSP